MGSYLRSLLQLRPKVEKDPRNLPLWRKRLLLGLVCFIAIIPGFCSTIYVCESRLRVPIVMLTPPMY